LYKIKSHSQSLPKRAFLASSKEILDKARSLYPAQPYRVTSDLGEVIVLPPELADEIRNNPRLSLATATYNDLNGDLPGFDIAKIGSHGDAILQAVIKKQLTKSLGEIILPLLISKGGAKNNSSI
jgi:hypothetical protein